MSTHNDATAVQCSICLENIVAQATRPGEKPRELKCHHLFHSLCIGEWLKNAHNCPMCRAPVEGEAPLAPRIAEETSWEDLILLVRQRVFEVRKLDLNENTQQAQTARKVSNIALGFFSK